MILLVLRIALLVLLWLFILFALNTLRRDTKAAAAQGMPGVPVQYTQAPPAPPAKRGAVPQEIAVVDGPLLGSTLALTQLNEVIIGRAQDCQFVLSDDYASSHHARLFKRGNEWFVEDLDSRNGTFTGGYRIDQPERVGVGSDIKIGRTTIRLNG
ncbi:FHA domain-containing protein FhaB [Corynebacterium gerontici]|uniref:FHA domain-containing protein FhaB n=1 Tax=Corynebacterium gerontici TaxID=2079234 RepID=A0A3G6IXT2_9CORY|nr:FHA domain-containing protein FhaB [Corynebacterium gerontici]